jgi:hypothetical protein
MDPIKRPTKAAIEAALSAYYGEVDEAARKDTLPEHQKVFDEIVMEFRRPSRGNHRRQHRCDHESFRRCTHRESCQEGQDLVAVVS